MSNSPKLERRRDVLARTGLSSSTLDRLEARGLFPRRRKIAGTMLVGWVADEISVWIESQPSNGESE